jgi:hypothetical protein
MNRIGHLLGRSHVTAVGLEHHRAAGSEGRSGVAASRGKCQGKVAGTEHRHRPEADAVLAQVRTRQRLALRQRQINARTVEITATQHVGEQAHLPLVRPRSPMIRAAGSAVSRHTIDTKSSPSASSSVAIASRNCARRSALRLR